MKGKEIWLINSGEPLPINGNKPHRMSHWKVKLSQYGFKVTFLTTDFEHQRKIFLEKEKVPDGYELLESKVRYRRNFSFSRVVNHYILGRSLRRYLASTKRVPDLILCSYPTVYMAYIATKFGKKNCIPVIVDIRDLWPDSFIKPIIGRVILFPLYFQKKFVLKNATKLIGVSPNYVRWASPKADVRLYTLPLTQYKVSSKSESIIQNIHPLKLIFVGTLGKTYNLRLINLISVFLSKHRVVHQIKVCGDGPRRKFLWNLTKENPNVKFLGWLNKEDLDNELRTSHIGLMLYKEKSPQGWPNKLIEYMSYGLPIINSLKGESWKIIDELKIGVNIDSDFLEPILEWIRKDVFVNYEEISTRTITAFEENFKEETVFKKLIEIIEDATAIS